MDYLLFNYTDAVVVGELYDSYFTSKCDFLSSYKKAKTKLSQVDAATIIYSLLVISKLKSF